ncbi:tripeptidyl aminopeptidase precursor [Streptomyces acidiscabies]|nr:tripeptidyl aminopeptidase precursor [Streptomyces acidiscabies]GAV38774.1 tripeptidyl aminopeptidase precursor [Streptomyces acidiscabies]
MSRFSVFSAVSVFSTVTPSASGVRRGAAVSGAVAAAMALAATGLTTAHAAAQPASTAAPQAPIPPRYTTQRLDWQPCPSTPALECAPMTVPRDWHHPGTGADLTVQVSRHRAPDPAQRRGVLVMAAGGPGASGLNRPAGFVKASPAVGAAYDVVGFDQRGVGSSTHATCQTDAEFQDFYAGDFRDRTPAALQGVINRSRQFVHSCLDRSGDLVKYLTTDQAVHDIDLLRTLLGVQKISYYGPSYATWLGAYYATEYPQHVERAVLDSNLAFDGTWEQAELGQPMSFQRRFEQDFLPWLAQHDAVYHYGRTAAEAKATWEARRAVLHDRPLTAGTVTVGPNQLDNATIQGMYNTGLWPSLASVLASLEHWDTATAAERQTAGSAFANYLSPGFTATYFPVTCNDTPWNRDLGHWLRQSAADTRKHPLVGARELAFAAVCAFWPESDAPHVKVTGEGLPPTLMLNSVHDPATYYEGALRAHRALKGSRLVTVTGAGDHGQYRNGNACVDAVVDAYLLDGKVPEHDMTCAAGS